jgi:hypothetical protein
MRINYNYFSLQWNKNLKLAWKNHKNMGKYVCTKLISDLQHPFCSLAELWPPWVGCTLVYAGLCPLWAAIIWCFALSCIAPLACPLLFWTPLDLYHCRLGDPGLRRIWTAPQGVLLSKGTFGTKPRSGHPGLSPGCLLLCVWPPVILTSEAWPHRLPLTCLYHQAWTSYAFTFLVAALRPKIIDGTHCCATMALDHIIAAMTYVMWTRLEYQCTSL